MPNDLFYRDKFGRKRDAGLHDEHPGDPEAYAKLSIERAMKRGLSREEAERRYGYTPEEIAAIKAERAKRDERA